MKELIISKNVDITHNMEVIKVDLAEFLKKYNYVVTDDTVKPTKKAMADINKDKTAFDKIFKQHLLEIEAPIKVLKEHKKNLDDMFKEARLGLSEQVKTFEDKKLLDIKKILLSTKEVMANENDIDHNDIYIDDLVKLSSVTASNKLTGSVIDIINSKITAVKLENAEKEKARLEREAYEKKLKDDAIAEHEKKQLEKEKQEKEKLEKEKLEKEQVSCIKEIDVTTDQQDNVSHVSLVDNKEDIQYKDFDVVIKFKIQAPDHIQQRDVENKVTDKLKALGLNSFEVYNDF